VSGNLSTSDGHTEECHESFAPMAESGPGTGDCETFRVMLVNLTSKDCHTDLIHARNAWQLTSIRVLFEFAEDC
jgi:hypothetical protein